MKFNFTYLSDNIESHAAPNNSSYYTKEADLKNGCHPYLNHIPYNALTQEDTQLLDELTKMNFITKGKYGYEKKPEQPGFPKLFISIKDKELKNISETRNPEHYQYLQNSHMSRLLRTNMDTINNIKVADLKPDGNPAEGFMKILGTSVLDVSKEVMMYGKNRQTLFAAAKRQLKTAPNPKSEICRDFLQYAIDRIEREIGDRLNDFSYDTSQWFNHLSAAKQKAIGPIKMYYDNPALFYATYSEQEARRILTEHYEAIVKSELQDPDGKPRMVCSIPQKIKYIMGPVCWQLEEICAKHLNGYCGGMNLTEMANKINDYAALGFTKVVEGDGSAFDNSQDVTLKALDRYIYNRILPKIYHVPKEDFEHVANLHYKTMDVKNYINGKPKTFLSYKVLGTVFSGDADTTLANTIRMAMYNLYVNEREGLRYGQHFVVFSKGDDFSVLYRESVPDELIKTIYSKYFLQKPEGKFKIYDNRQYGIGQICKFLEIGDLASFKFCSLRSWYKDEFHETITLTRNPAKLYTLSQYAIKPKRYSLFQLYQYHMDQATAYETSYKGIEIFEIMAQAHRDHATYLYNKYSQLPCFSRKVQNYTQRLLQQKIRLKTVELGYGEKYNKLLAKLMDIKGRENYEDMIYANYWDNIQAKERIRTEINTKQECEYINQQINAEFDTEELKSLVGLKNF